MSFYGTYFTAWSRQSTIEPFLVCSPAKINPWTVFPNWNHLCFFTAAVKVLPSCTALPGEHQTSTVGTTASPPPPPLPSSSSNWNHTSFATTKQTSLSGIGLPSSGLIHQQSSFQQQNFEWVHTNTPPVSFRQIYNFLTFSLASLSLKLFCKTSLELPTA